MTLRTPRRRISPRTKLRYRAIREFFRRALGSTSQQEIKINSSIAVNVTDLKRKIVGLEHQLDEVNKHCRDFACLENCSRRESDTLLQYDLKHEIDTIKEQTEASSERKSNGLETKLIYQSSDCNYKKSEDSDNIPKPNYDNNVNENPMMDEYNGYVNNGKNKKSKPHHLSNTGSKLHKHKARSVYDNIVTAYSTSSFHSLANTRTNHNNVDYPSYSYDRKQSKKNDTVPEHNKESKCREFIKKNIGDHFKSEDKTIRVRKNKRHTREVDSDFIADIIRRQYKPVKMFGRKESDLSQFSVPVCRDQEFSIHENIQEDSELCSCFYGGRRHKRSKPKRQDLNGMRSVCDTRLYSSNKLMRPKHRRMHVDAYSNSDMYDLVPVKERSSPKSRRKFVEDNMIPYEYYREVPPSPRTLRPRLNLKAQHCTELEDYMVHAKQQLRRRLPHKQKRYVECVDNFETDITSELITEKKPQTRNPENLKVCPVKEMQAQEQSQQPETGTMSSLHYPKYVNEQTSITVDTTLNKTQETEITVDKTDKALCEIKDILQSFLHEIKKETVASQCDKSDITCKTQDNDSNVLQDSNPKINNNILPNNSFNNYSVGQCGITPYMAPFSNQCCYPVMPLCPINCPLPITNGYLMPSQSFTCTNCLHVPKESTSAHCCEKNTEVPCNSETDQLIKEIYKFVAQSPIKKQDTSNANNRKHEASIIETKVLTSRSVGGSYKNFQLDAKVGTPPLKCYSKSCEAIGSRMISDTYNSATNASYSDTLLEKLSLEATTHSTSQTELDVEFSDQDKNKKNKFSKVLRSIGLFKKKKKDVIEELSESESVIDVEVKPKQPPFKQEITNYMMHGQDYYRSPPVEPLYQRRLDYQRRQHDYQQGPHEYPPNGYQRPHDYPPRSPECQPRGYEYQPRVHECQPRPHEYQPRPHAFQSRPQEYQPDYHPPYNPGVRGYPSPTLNDSYGPIHNPYQPRMHDHPNARSPVARQRPTAPPYSSSYDTSYSQVQPPLCLKEIEVKSTGTQSERKMSIFRKIKKRMQQPIILAPTMAAGDQRNFSTQTAPVNTKPLNNVTKPLFNWKGLQPKAMRDQNMDPLMYSYKKQKELAAGDQKIRKAVLKKLFYKRNPFSPRNLIVRTLLGKDKSSYGDAPGMFRPKMFF